MKVTAENGIVFFLWLPLRNEHCLIMTNFKLEDLKSSLARIEEYQAILDENPRPYRKLQAAKVARAVAAAVAISAMKEVAGVSDGGSRNSNGINSSPHSTSHSSSSGSSSNSSASRSNGSNSGSNRNDSPDELWRVGIIACFPDISVSSNTSATAKCALPAPYRTAPQGKLGSQHRTDYAPS